MEKYKAAKERFDLSAAANIIENCWSCVAEDLLIDKLRPTDCDPLIVFPHPSFDDETGDGFNTPRKTLQNALPFSMATYLAARLGGEVQCDIVQIARVGRTKLPLPCRFLWQPVFGGNVSTTRPYILVDDVVTLGGTLAALRSYIINRGGTVVAVSALAHKTCVHQKFAIRPRTETMLHKEYGAELGLLWKETIGHDISCLTEGEAGVLIRWGDEFKDQRSGTTSLFGLRNRLAEASIA